MKYEYDFALSYATEDKVLVEKVYHYLKAEGFSVFFAPALECQQVLSGRNQREVFYEVFGLKAKFVALFVSNNYVSKEVPMEEAGIAFAKHSENASVLPIYLDGTKLPEELFDHTQFNYFESKRPAEIASHLAGKVSDTEKKATENSVGHNEKGIMNVKNNKGEKQLFVQTLNGSINL